MKQKKIIVVGVALIAVILIVAGTATALLHNDSNSYASKVQLGYRYLQEGDYDNAILMFRQAIEMDESKEDAYYGLYQAYLYSGQNEYALTALNIGITATNSSQLQALLAQMQATLSGGSEAVTQPQQDAQQSGNDSSDSKTMSAVLNSDLLNVFATANYSDYCLKYGYAAGTMGTDQYSLHLNSIGATLVFKATGGASIIDNSTGTPYSNLMPDEIRLDNVMTLFGGVESLTFETLQSMNGVQAAAISGNTVTFTYKDCAVTIVCDGNMQITSGCENHLVPTKRTTALTQLTLKVTVVDATTNRTVSGALVKLYNEGSTSGTPVSQASTDSAGQVSLTVSQSGNYTAVVEKDGFITDSFSVQIMSGADQTEATFGISPVISGGGIRLVLTWGATPSDLDSHLIGSAGDGSSVHVYFGSKHSYASNGNTTAELDLDDTSSYGPETTTIYDTQGSYEFYVDDFTNSGMISSSGATVKIYVGDALYATVEIPQGIEDQWHVCTIVNGVVTVTNRSR